MKKFASAFRFALPVLLVVGVLFSGAPSALAAIGTPTAIDSTTSTGTTNVLSVSSTIPIGNTVIVTVAMDGTNGTVSVSDTHGNTYTKDADKQTGTGGGSDVRTLVFSAPITSALTSGNSITVTLPSASSSAHAMQVSGLLTTSPTDKTASAIGTGTSASSGSTATTAQSNELLIGAIGVATSNHAITGGGSPWVSFPTVTPSSPGAGLLPEYQIVAAAGTYAATGTFTNDTWAAAIVTYKATLTATTTTVATSGTPTTYGSAVTFTATVNNLSATGNVNFFDGVTQIGTGALSTVSGQRQASYTTTGTQLNASTHSITATYVGDSTFATSTSSAISQVVNPKALTAAGTLAASAKIYNKTTTATLTGSEALQTAEAPGTGTTLDGKPYTGDTISLTGSPTGTFVSANVGTPVSVTVTGTSLTGAQSGNYTLTQPSLSANITPKALTVSGLTANAKVYDKTAVATFTGSATLQASETAGTGTTSDGKPYTGDTVTPLGSPTGTFVSANVGTPVAVTVTGITTANTNYTITQPTGLSANITPATLTYNANTASRAYGSSNPAFSGTVTGFVSTDNQGNATTGTLTFTSSAINTSPVGSYAINGSGLTANNSNYTFVQAASNATALTINKANAVIVITPYSVTYDGGAHTATGTATGVLAENLNGLLTLTGTTHTAAGTYLSDPWSFAGNTNYNIDSGTTSDSIGQASSTVTVTCPLSSQTYTGSAITPCSASYTTEDGLSGSLTVDYTDNTDVGTAGASAEYLGDANHSGDTDSATFAIGQASSTVTVTCPLSSQTYTGSAITPCSASYTTEDGLSGSLTVDYTDNTDVGTAGASAEYLGDANHSGDTDSATFAIGQASSTVTVTCPLSSQTYTGSAITPCSASYTTEDGLSGSLTVDYTDNTDVGTAGASAEYLGDANHSGDTDSATFAIGQASSTVTVTCPLSSQTYTGSAITPCSASYTTEDGLSGSLTVDYTDNTDVGTAGASAEYLGDANHSGDTDSATFAIGQASSTVTVTCPLSSQTYTGSAITPCSASYTTEDGLSGSLTVDYTDNTDVGTAGASAEYLGDANHSGDTDSATFAIGQASSTVTVTCPLSSQTYTGSAITPCSASYTTEDGLSGSLTVDYTDNTDVGTAGASAEYLGDANHSGDTDSATFAIGQASSTVTVTCPLSSQTYTGSAITPCSASYTTEDGLSGSLTVDYTDNTDVGTAGASAEYLGDANHSGDTDSATFAIGQASSTVTVTCPLSSQTYTGSAITPCSASYTTEDGLSGSLTVDYTDNTDVGTAGASAEYLGDANHSGDTDSATFAIGQASSTVTVTCPLSSQTYTGSAITPCSASYTTEDGLSGSLTVDYTDNTDVGTAGASAEYLGDANHSGDTDSATFAIGQASSTVTVTCPLSSQTYTGSAITPCSASYTTEDGLSGSLTVDYTDNTDVGTAGASAEYLGDANHSGDTDSATFAIGQASSTVTVTCPLSSQTYTGSAITPCSASYTTEDGLSGSLTVDYTDNTDVGTAGASAEYLGDANHSGDTDSATFAIGQASSTVTVTCPLSSQTYTGSAITPCSASYTTEDGLSGSLTVDYTDNTDVGTAGASAEYLGDANHSGDTDSATFAIGQASSTVTVTCPLSSQTYTGSAITPCSASYTTEDGLSGSLTVDYTDNTDVGTAGASAEYLGDANHSGDTDSATFAIGQASSTVTVTCPLSSQTYTGSAITPCSASYTTEDGLSGSLTVDYTDNTDVGTAGASAEYLGDANHSGDTDSATFAIGQASSTVTVTCPLSSQTYTGSAITPCSASYTTEDGLSGSLTVDYTDNTDVGTAGASAEYLGDANHSGDTDSATFAIGQAGNTITVNTHAPATWTYNANFFVDATASSGLTVQITTSGVCSGSGTGSVSVLMTSGTGTCTVHYNQAGDGNYSAATEVTEDVTATKADQEITFGALSDKNFGDADFDVSATGGFSGNPVTFTASGDCSMADDNTVHLTAVGSCTITAHQLGNADFQDAADVPQSFDVNDNTAPDTSITSHPSNPTSSTSATFEFSSTEVGSTFKCKLDSEAEADCESGVGGYLGLSDGSHTFTVKAKDTAGNEDPTPAEFTWTVDTQGPTVTITNPVDGTTVGTSVHFTYTTGDSATFTCQVDAVDAGADCDADGFTRTLSNGLHAFSVTGVDALGNDTTANITFTVDASGPVVNITSGPAEGSTTATDSGSFTFTSEVGATFTCTLDGDSPVACDSGTFNFGPLSEGSHTFTVHATDTFGNSGSDSSRTWTVDAVGPVITLQDASNPTDTTITVTWHTDESSTSRVVYDTVSHASLDAGVNYGYASSTVEDSNHVTDHSVLVSGLSNGTTYFFRGVSHGSPETVSPEVSDTTTTPQVSTGSIKVCKVIEDTTGAVVAGEAGSTFTIPFVDASYEGAATGTPASAVFNTSLSLETVFGSVQGECVTYNELPIGRYYYGEEEITSDSTWDTPKYNDQVNMTVDDLSDLQAFNPDLNPSFDNWDGVINVNADQTRTLIVLNKLVDACPNKDGIQNSNSECLPPPPTTATIHATKVVCDSETDLPNWGGGGPDITDTTASQYVIDHPTCHLADWTFQWAPASTTNPGDAVGEADAPWTSFSGSAEVPGGARVWVREEASEDYIPFSGDITDPRDQDVSAELYCSNDVLNYDNYDYVDPVIAGETYNCVGFNVPIVPQCVDTEVSTTIVSNTDTMEGDNAAVLVDPIHIRWTAFINGASWIWGENPIADPTIDTTETFTKEFTIAGTPTGATLEVAADNTYSVTVNGNAVCDDADTNESDPNNYNYQSTGQDTCAISADKLVTGDNTIEFTVKNIGRATAQPGENPGGLMYKLTLNSTECVPPTPTECPEGQHAEGDECVNNPAPTCDDGIMNQDETGIDTGGVCTPPPLECGEGFHMEDNECVPNEVPPPTHGNTQCSDGIDNDGDGKTDYPADNGCKNLEDDNETDSHGGHHHGGGGGGGGYIAPIVPKVLGAQDVCNFAIDTYMRKGYSKNNPAQVKVLQEQILNALMNAGLTVDGVYGSKTEAAVKAFQAKYGDEILKPWGIPSPTGIFYKTTLVKAKNLVCPVTILPIPTDLINWSANPEVSH